jgi:hypothetical protein
MAEQVSQQIIDNVISQLQESQVNGYAQFKGVTVNEALTKLVAKLDIQVDSDWSDGTYANELAIAVNQYFSTIL